MYWGCIGKMEKSMETIILEGLGFRVYIGVILGQWENMELLYYRVFGLGFGAYIGLYWDRGKENGNY